MNSEAASQIQEYCKQLKLGHLGKIYAQIEAESHETFLLQALKSELQARQAAKIQRFIKKGGFSHHKTFEDYEPNEGITFPETLNMEMLKDLVFMEKYENVMMLGAVGTGKSHLAIATGMEACRQGKYVRFFKVSDLVSILLEKHQSGTLKRLMKDLRKVELLILDELGFIPFHQDGSQLLFDVISECYETTSVIVTTNLEFGQWNSVFGDKRLTAAIIDRLVHHAHILSFTGQSYRLRHAMSNKSGYHSPQVANQF